MSTDDQLKWKSVTQSTGDDGGVTLSQQLDNFQFITYNKGIYNSYLKNERISKARQKKNVYLREKTKKLEAMLLNKGQQLNKAASEKVKDAPFDPDFWFRMEPGLDQPKMKLPE